MTAKKKPEEPRRFTAADIRAVNAGARRVYCPKCERGHEGPCRAKRRRA